MHEHDAKAVNKAFNLAVFGLVGSILPLLGIILSFIAVLLANSADVTGSLAKRQRLVKGLAIFSIVVSLVCGYGGYAIWSHQKTEAQATADKQRQVSDKQANEKYSRMFDRDLCLGNADKDYRESWEQESRSLGRSDGKLPSDQVAIHEQRFANAKNECYMRYGNE